MGFEATDFEAVNDTVPSEEDRRRQVMYSQGLLMRCALEFLESSEEEMQGKALDIIDSLIEASKKVLCGPKITVETEQIETNHQLDEHAFSPTGESRRSSIEFEPSDSSHTQGTMSRSTSFLEATGNMASRSGQLSNGQVTPLPEGSQLRSAIEVLADADPGPLLSILSDALNRHCRCRDPKKAESYVRWQIYVTRALAATSFFTIMQKRLVKEVHIGSLLAPFDKANDPVRWLLLSSNLNYPTNLSHQSPPVQFSFPRNSVFNLQTAEGI